MYELSNLDHMPGVVSQTRVSGGNPTHYPLDYQGTHKIYELFVFS